jgi:hydroxymethylglutaryl-CoA lyase
VAERAAGGRAGEGGPVLLEDQTLRDGLQNEPRLLSLEDRLEIARLLAAAGVRRLQVGSYVDPPRVPQMAGTEELVAQVRQELPGVECTALALNDRGLERALGCGLRRLSLSVSLADSHSRRNAGCGASEALLRVVGLVGRAREEGMVVRAGLQCAFGSDREPVDRTRVVAAAEELVAAGAAEINLADTAGKAGPDEVARLVGRVRQAVVAVPLSLHLHGSRQRTRANLLAGYRAGVRLFDVALNGLGGCPFVSGAGGNVATEEAAGLFASLGTATGLDVPALAAAAGRTAQLLGRPLRPPESPGSG